MFHIENNQHEIFFVSVFFRISLASNLRILRIIKLIFFYESFTSFLKIPQA